MREKYPLGYIGCRWSAEERWKNEKEYEYVSSCRLSDLR